MRLDFLLDILKSKKATEFGNWTTMEIQVEIHRDVVFIPEDGEHNNDKYRNEKDNELLSLNLDLDADPEPDIDPELENIHEPENDLSDINFDNSNEIRESTLEEKIGRRPGRREMRKPKKYEDYEMNSVAIHKSEEPTNYEEAMASNDSEKWKHAMEEGKKALEENETWYADESVSDSEVIECKWVYRKKRDEKGQTVSLPS